jgi:hypothetical protein
MWQLSRSCFGRLEGENVPGCVGKNGCRDVEKVASIELVAWT